MEPIKWRKEFKKVNVITINYEHIVCNFISQINE